MSNKNKKLTVPTGEIKLLLKSRGQSQTSMAAATGVSLCVLNKFLNNRTYKDKSGNDCTFNVPHIRSAIAKYLNIPQEILWSSAGSATLKKLFADEMAAKGRFPKKTYKKQKTKPWRITTFVKNIIALGK